MNLEKLMELYRAATQPGPHERYEKNVLGPIETEKGTAYVALAKALIDHGGLELILGLVPSGSKLPNAILVTKEMILRFHNNVAMGQDFDEALEDLIEQC